MAEQNETSVLGQEILLNPAVETPIGALVNGRLADPFTFLGPQPVETPAGRSWIVHFFRPGMASAEIVILATGQHIAAKKIHAKGVFEADFPSHLEAPSSPADYKIIYHTEHGDTWETYDAYAFPYSLTEFDLHLMGEGRHYDTHEKLGAHIKTVAGVRGVNFAVWAPSAKRVSIVGDFNQWDGRVNPMRSRGSSGIWELFVPEIAEGSIYKYELIGPAGELLPLKADPYGFRAEVRPKSGSIVATLENYSWNDGQWMRQRERRNWLEAPISIYEVHLGAWRRVPEEGHRSLTYRELADQLIPYVKELGYSHIELLPVMEYPFDASWGYQTIGYYAPTSRYGSPAEFMEFIDRCHQAGIGVLLDWTPAHFPRDAHGLAYFDGTHLYEHSDPRQGEHPDWGTLIYNYGRNEVQNYLISNALFWLDKYHIDGLRVDAVASMLYLDYSRKDGEWIPNEFGGRENLAAIAFLKRLNEVAYERFPGLLTVAEESTAWPAVSRPTYLGGLGFTLKWNMGWMNDTLQYFSQNPVHRKYLQNKLTFSLLYAFTENFVLPFSHDEVVHGKGSMLHKMPGDTWQQFANLRLLYAYQYGHPGKKLLFMGQEFAQRGEFTEVHSLEWHLLAYEPHQGIQSLVRDLNRLYAAEPALHEIDFDWHGFEWLDCNDADNSVFSFVRHGKRPEDVLVVVLNATPVVREKYRVGLPHPGFYSEVLNTDSAFYGGTNVGNGGGVQSEPIVHVGRDQSATITLPPLAAVFLKLSPA